MAERYAAIAQVTEAKQALEYLREDFASEEHVGPRRAAAFLTGREDPEIQADAFGYVQRFLSRVTAE